MRRHPWFPMSQTISLAFPLHCAVCSEPEAAGGPRGGLCRACAGQRRPPPVLPVPEGLDACLAAYSYESVVKHEVLAMKAAGRYAVIPSMAGEMFRILGAAISPDAIVTWAPTTRERRQRRGFDHAEELARAFGRFSGLPVARILRRVSRSAQHGSDRQGREAVRFSARPMFAGGEWPQIVIVDDVRTTGATFGAAARAIRDRGGREIIGIAYAATPDRR